MNFFKEIQQPVNEGPLDDVRARMDARRDPPEKQSPNPTTPPPPPPPPPPFVVIDTPFTVKLSHATDPIPEILELESNINALLADAVPGVTPDTVFNCAAVDVTNVPFNDTEIFMGKILSEVDKKIAIIPDFIANCGMARVFAFLMENEGEITDEILFKDASDVIKKALQKTYEVCPKGINLTEKSLDIAIKELQNRK